MSYYGYQYKQQCYIPGGMKIPTPAIPQPCHGPGLLPCSSCSSCSPCSPCSPSGAKLCTVRKTLASPSCVETRVVQGHRCSSSSSSSCSSSRCLGPCPGSCPVPFPQGGEVAVLRGCPQVCQDSSSCPYSSYQWSNSYQYKCGQ